MGRSEINLVRLIAQCENMMSMGKKLDDWRIQKVWFIFIAIIRFSLTSIHWKIHCSLGLRT